MDANEHAIALLAVLPLGVALLGKFGFRPRTAEDWLLALFLAPAGYLFTAFVVVLLGRSSMCGPIPVTQWGWPALIAGMCAATARTWKIRFALVLLFSLIGALLGIQYFDLLKSKEQYAGLGDNGRPYITCDKPVTAYELWHSWFTGIYGLKPK